MRNTGFGLGPTDFVMGPLKHGFHPGSWRFGHILWQIDKLTDGEEGINYSEKNVIFVDDDTKTANLL